MSDLNFEGLSDNQLRLFAVRCARRVQHLMTDPRSIAALDVAERYANGQATDDELSAARNAASAAAEDAAEAAVRNAAGAAKDAAWEAACAAAEAAASAAAWAAWDAARDAAWAAASAATWVAAEVVEVARDAAMAIKHINEAIKLEEAK